MGVPTKRVQLYKNHINSIGTWVIWNVDNVILIEHSTVIGGSPVKHKETVPEGKASRSLQEQVYSRMRSRIRKQFDKGYVKTYEEALKPPTNALNMVQPMLAQPLKRVSSVDYNNSFMQLKYEGHRCLITKHNGKMKAYSRQGKWITTIDHILKHLGHLEEGVTLDGELYHHGTRLQTISSWVKRRQENTSKLVYMMYDVVSPEPFADRLSYLSKLNSSLSVGSPVIFATTLFIPNVHDFNLKQRLLCARECGYEGLIIRQNTKGYDAGRRSNSLVKVKACIEDHFEIVDVNPSKEGWGVLALRTREGREFGASAPGSFDRKLEFLVNKHEYIGRLINIEFAFWTADEVPFQPVALDSFRDDI